MNFSFSPDEERFRQEVREFIAREAGPEVLDPRRDTTSQLVDTPERRAFMKKLAQKGWLGLSWPKEYGGKGLPGLYEYILNEELAWAGAPLVGKGVGIIGNTLMRHGSEKMKQFFLPKILRAEIEFALGYTEPEAGSDLASLQLRAVREGDGWRLNGQKRFTTSAHFSDWYWAAARTDPEAPKHKGISLFLIDLKTPGLTIQAMETMGNERTNEVFFDNVWVPGDQLVGEINKGWYYISEALDYERFTLFTFGPLQKKFEMLLSYVNSATRDGVPLREDPVVRQTMATLATHVEVARMQIMRVITTAGTGRVPNVEAAMSKLWSTHLGQRLSNAALDLMGAAGQLIMDSPHAPLDGKLELSYRCTVLDTIGGGSSEVQKNIIARRGLGLQLQ